MEKHEIIDSAGMLTYWEAPDGTNILGDDGCIFIADKDVLPLPTQEVSLFDCFLEERSEGIEKLLLTKKTDLYSVRYSKQFKALFLDGVKHDARITVDFGDEHSILRHTFSVRLKEASLPSSFMLVSTALLSFFQTHGKSFAIQYGNIAYSSEDSLDEKNKRTILNKGNGDVMRIFFEHGTVELSLNEGDYTHFTVKTDKPKEYVMVSAHFGFKKKQYVPKNSSTTGVCVMRYFPK